MRSRSLACRVNAGSSGISLPAMTLPTVESVVCNSTPAVAVIAMSYPSSALDKALSIASLINGPVLGVFLVGTFLRRVSEPPALVGMVASIVVMLYVRFYTPLAWTWYVLLGSGITLLVAWLASFAFAPPPVEQRDELAPTSAAD